MYNKYLVTGATGFLGRAVVEELARRGAQVRALALPDCSRRRSAPSPAMCAKAMGWQIFSQMPTAAPA